MTTDVARILPSQMLPTEDGVYFDVPRDVYDEIDREHWSTLKHAKRSMAHHQAAEAAEESQESEESNEQLLGNATHVTLMEPATFKARYAVFPGERKQGNKWEAFKEENRHKKILTTEQADLAFAMAQAVREDEHAGPFFRGGSAEVTVLWTAEGIQCKARPDYLHEAKAITDLKTAQDASPEAFSRAAYNFGYFDQGAFYRGGLAVATKLLLPFFLVAVEKEAPHVVQVYGVPDAILDAYDAANRTLLRRVAECRAEEEKQKEKRRWPGYADGVLDLELPRWAKVG